MSEHRPTSPDRASGNLANPHTNRQVDRQIARDADALRTASRQELPSFTHFAQRLRANDITHSGRAARRALDTSTVKHTRTNEYRPKTTIGESSMTHTKQRKMWLRIAALAFVFSMVGVVFATTGTDWITFWVETDGKSDEQIETEIEDQLVEGGMVNPSVDVNRNGNHTRVKIDGEQGGKQIRLVKKEVGGNPGVIQMQHEMLDTEREPGMTDEQLEQKILAQLQARGMTDATVEVNGDEIRVKVEQEVEEEAEE